MGPPLATTANPLFTRRKCGSDAVQYIKFQRHMIIFVLIIAIVCMIIILPINFTMGDIQVNC